VYEQFGAAPSQYFLKIVFPIGKVKYEVYTPQGISAGVYVDGIKEPFSKVCRYDDEDGFELGRVYEYMKQLKFKEHVITEPSGQ
jgi:hypothetical protein